LSGDASQRVDISGLRLGAVLGSGGQGQVTAVDSYLIDGRWQSALKTYNSAVTPDYPILEKIVSFPGQLHRNDRDWLMGITSWPLAIAEDSGVARGFLMRVVPSVYNFSYTSATQGVQPKLSTVEYLLNSDDYVIRAGISISDRDRLNLLGTLAQTMSRLHALGIVIGDLSPKNLLFNLNSYSSCFLIDCDAVALHGESALQQVDTPDWEVPDGERKATEASDSYKFGLLAIRLFARDQSSRDISALSALSPELGRLARLSQDQNPASRPGPGVWVDAIQSAAAAIAARTVPVQPAPGSAQVGQSYAGYSGARQPPAAVPGPGPGVASPRPGAPPQRPGVPQPGPRPRRKPSSAAKALVTLTAAILILAGVIAGLKSSHANTGNFSADTSQGGSNAGGSPAGGGSPGDGGSPADGSPEGSPPAGSGAPGSQGSPSAQPTNVGIVSIGDNVTGDSAATQVAEMFNTYFSNINSKNYQQALSVFDPSGLINPNDSSEVQQFANGVSTTTDSSVTLVNIDPSDGSTVQTAEVQFTSDQQAGYGPPDDPGSTCTNWDITYELTVGSSGNYLINNVSNSSDSAC
jgi:eukaryotic-like serine/threonine-protein kinase